MPSESIEQMNLITSFESMPNELLMELFEYYDLYSLFFSFDSLNSRISNILHYCQVSVDLDRVQSGDIAHFLSHILPQINPKKIRSLHSSKWYELTVLVHDKSLDYFTDIRSLSFNNIKPNTVQRIISRIYFSHLERVVLDKNEDIYGGTRSFFKHFLDSNRYRFLRTYKDSYGRIENLTSVSSIEYVTILNLSTLSDLLNFLNQTPNLKYLKGKLKTNDKSSEPIFISSMPYYQRLTHLNLQIDGQICMKKIVYLFKCAPRISQLKLKIYSHGYPESTDPIFWETTLSKYLIKLKRLCLFVYTTDSHISTNPYWKLIQKKDEICKQIRKSNYWSSHQWITTFNSGIPMPYLNFYWAKFDVA